MRWPLSCAFMFLIGVASVAAQAPPPPTRSPAPSSGQGAASGVLPVRRVVLYKTGVGYFEHLGHVRNRQDVTVRFTSAQLNDVLKSLTTIDLGQGQITGISYNSIAPIDQRLGALRLPLGAGASTVDLLGSLRGARIEAGSGPAAVIGRLSSVERQTRAKGDQAFSVDSLSVVTDGGEVRSFELRYTRQLDDQESRLETLRTEIAGTAKRRDSAREELNALIGSLTFDAG